MIHAISGMPGVGKTTLAVHLVHLLAARYPDAQLFIDLQGHSEQAPLPPAAAVAVLLRQLRVPGDRIPDGFDERLSMWRRELAGRRTVLLLDNAASAEQVAPLLPVAPGCLTVVTSRRRLAELDGARAVSLGVLTVAEAMLLQRRIVGSRVDAAPDAAQDVARRCGHLALAIRLAAARLAHRPGWSVADLAARLSRTGSPLRELALPGRSVQAAFALSYQDLSEPAGRLFRLLGLHPGPDIDMRAAAALAGLDVDKADEVLAELVDTHLIEEPSAGRYRLHDLIRDYAAGLAADEPERDPAIDRLLAFYLHAAAACESWLHSMFMRPRANLGEPPQQVAPPQDARAAADWFVAEEANIAAGVRLAAATGRDRMSFQLTQATWWFVFAHGHLDEFVALCELAMAAAERSGDPHGEAAAFDNLAGVHYTPRGRWEQALRLMDRAIALQATLDRPALHAGALHRKAILLQLIGDYPAALRTADQASRIVRARDRHTTGSGIDLTIGQLKACMGEDAAAERHFQTVLDGLGGRRSEYLWREALCHVGALRVWRGRFAEAADLLREASTDWEDAAPPAQSMAAAWLGTAYCGLGRLDDALRQHSHAMALVKRQSDVAIACKVRVQYAITLHAAADVPGALAQLADAFDICERVRLPLHQAQAEDAVADIYTDTDEARGAQHRSRADAIYTRLGVIRTASVLAAYRATERHTAPRP